MLSKTILAFAGLVAAAQAIMVTSPTKDEKLDFSKSIEVKWTSVSSDPSTFNLVLVDQTNMTPIPVGSNVKTSDGSFTLTNFVATPGASYKFNLMSVDPMNTGILAQSQTFSITKSGGAESSSSSSEDSTSTTTTGAAKTTETSSSTTMTTKTTSSGSPTKTGAASGSETANASSTGAAPTTSSNAAVAMGAKTFGVAGSIFAGLVMLL